MGIAFFGAVFGLTEDLIEAFTAQGYDALHPDGKERKKREPRFNQFELKKVINSNVFTDMKKNATIWLCILPVHLVLTIVMFTGLTRVTSGMFISPSLNILNSPSNDINTFCV